MQDSIYDQMNQWDQDDDFFVKLIASIQPKSIVDLGCGTGRVTLYLANKGYKILGVDPDKEAIETAKQKDTRQSVQWIVGTSNDLKDQSCDLVMMTSNVAQVFIDDNHWNKVLFDIHNSLNQGGYLIFDTRNPLQRAWENWTKEKTKKVINEPITGNQLIVWHEMYEHNNSLVKYRTIYQKLNLQRSVEDNVLKFRTKEQIINNLINIGFIEIKVYGDWKFKQADQSAKSFIFVAKKR